MSKKKKSSLHHCQPVSQEQNGYNCHHEDNEVMLRNHKHEGIHKLNQDATVHELYIRITEINYKILKREVRRAIKAIMKLPPENIYIPEMFQPDFNDFMDEDEREDKRSQCRERLIELINNILEQEDDEKI